MKRRTKQFVNACLIVAAFTGTGAVSARADYHGIPDKVTLAQSKRSVAPVPVKAATIRHAVTNCFVLLFIL